MKFKRVFAMVFTSLLSVSVLFGCSNQNVNTEEKVEVTETKETERNVTPEVKTPDEALTLLKEGNQRFVDNKLANKDLGEERREELVKGQKPFAVVVTCSDSRVVPEHVFNQGLGDVFVIRVAGNILDEAELGSVEYAVDHLESKVVVILGHESCGAVTTAVAKVEDPEGTVTTSNIDAFLDNIEPAVVKAKDTNLEGTELVEETANINVDMAMEELLNKSELIKTASDKGEIKIVGGKYILSSGSIDWR